MGCFFMSGLFWGVLLILLGLSVILNILLGIHIPIFRIFFALMMIYFGCRILIGRSFCGRHHVCEPRSTATINPENENNVVFGKRIIDFTGISLANGSVSKKVDTVFGSTTIKIDPKMPVIINVNSVFAGAHMPDNNEIAFGKYTYRTESFNNKANALVIEANVVFGELNIVFESKQ